MIIEFKVNFDEHVTEEYNKLADEVLKHLSIADLDFLYIRNSITDGIFKVLKQIPTGLISEKAYKAYTEGYITKAKLCKEHFHSRTAVSRKIIGLYKDGQLDHDALVRILFDASLVHYVMPDENTALRPYQQDPTIPWHVAYQKAGVVLRVFIPKTTIEIYRNDILAHKFDCSADANRAGYSKKVLDSLKKSSIVEIKRTHANTAHLYVAGDTLTIKETAYAHCS